MRILPILAALILFGSGILAIIFPRDLVIGHARYGARSIAVPLSTLEYVSKTGCRYYGVLAVVSGAMMMWGSLGSSNVPLSDRSVAKSIVRTKEGLELSFGVTDRCTVGQVEAAVKASKVSPRHLPYLCAAFMGKDEFDQLRASIPDVDWGMIEDRVARIARELPYKELNGDHFHESWIPTVDN